MYVRNVQLGHCTQKDDFLVISITSHYGFIGAFLRVCEHHPWVLSTGGEYL